MNSNFASSFTLEKEVSFRIPQQTSCRQMLSSPNILSWNCHTKAPLQTIMQKILLKKPPSNSGRALTTVKSLSQLRRCTFVVWGCRGFLMNLPMFVGRHRDHCRWSYQNTVLILQFAAYMQGLQELKDVNGRHGTTGWFRTGHCWDWLIALKVLQ